MLLIRLACLPASLTSCFSHVRLFATPLTTSLPGSSVKGFSRQEYWSVLPYPSPGHRPNPGIEPSSLISPALAGGFFTTNTTWKAPIKLALWPKVLLVFPLSLPSYNHPPSLQKQDIPLCHPTSYPEHCLRYKNLEHVKQKDN